MQATSRLARFPQTRDSGTRDAKRENARGDHQSGLNYLVYPHSSDVLFIVPSLSTAGVFTVPFLLTTEVWSLQFIFQNPRFSAFVVPRVIFDFSS